MLEARTEYYRFKTQTLLHQFFSIQEPQASTYSYLTPTLQTPTVNYEISLNLLVNDQ